MSQSSNDTFPTAMHIAARIALEDKLIPSVKKLIDSFRKMEEENKDIAYSEKLSLKEACVKLGFLSSEKFDEIFHPEQMV